MDATTMVYILVMLVAAQTATIIWLALRPHFKVKVHHLQIGDNNSRMNEGHTSFEDKRSFSQCEIEEANNPRAWVSPQRWVRAPDGWHPLGDFHGVMSLEENDAKLRAAIEAIEQCPALMPDSVKATCLGEAYEEHNRRSMALVQHRKPSGGR